MPPPEKPAEITGKITAVAMTGKRALLEAKLIDATPDDTVVTLKVKIEALLGIPLDQQQLVRESEHEMTRAFHAIQSVI